MDRDFEPDLRRLLFLSLERDLRSRDLLFLSRDLLFLSWDLERDRDLDPDLERERERDFERLPERERLELKWDLLVSN